MNRPYGAFSRGVKAFATKSFRWLIFYPSQSPFDKGGLEKLFKNPIKCVTLSQCNGSLWLSRIDSSLRSE